MAKVKKKAARPAVRPTARKPAAKKAVIKPFALPPLRKGEIYAGVLLKDGKPAHHLILLPGHKTEPVKWENAMAWAKAQGGELPTRKEGALLLANAAEQFETQWYWTKEVHPVDSGYAFIQSFSYGLQNHVPKDYDYRARAVRRVPL